MLPRPVGEIIVLGNGPGTAREAGGGRGVNEEDLP